MQPELDNKNGLLIVRVVLFGCALVVVMAGAVAAFGFSSEPKATSSVVEYLVPAAAVLSGVSFLVLIVGKNYLSKILETRIGAARLQVFVTGTIFLMAISEGPGLLWALCAYLFAEPLYSIGAVAHAVGIILLWPDGSELENGGEGTEQ